MNGHSNTLAHSSPLRKGSSFRQLIHSAVSWLMMALSVIFGVGGTVAVFFGAAFLLDSSSALFVVAFCVGFLIPSGGAWVAARMMTRARPGRIALGVGGATMLLLALVTAVTIFPPLGSTAAAREAPPLPRGVGYWTLNTGSHLAYLKVPAQGRAKATPILMAGGGPGEADLADTSQTQFFGQLASEGYDVYFYHQIGSGLSARLADPGQYTLARHVADLEAIR